MAVADLVFHNIQHVLAAGRTEDVLGWRSPLFAETNDPHVMRLLQHMAGAGGNVDAALTALNDTLQDDPHNIRWRLLRAGILRHAGYIEQAVTDIAATFYIAPPDDETLRTFIDLVLQTKSYARAIDALAPLAREYPERALVHDLMGSVLQLAKRCAEAIPYHERALALDQQNADFANNFGTTLRQLGIFDQAEHLLRLALRLHPGHYMAWYNLGNVLRMTGRTRESIQAYRNSIAIHADYPEAHFTLACSLLQLGEWNEGWREWEWRFRSAAIVPPISIDLPVWDGSNPQGRRILVVAEQGSGDTLQFARYTQLLAQRGAQVTIWAPQETAALLARLPHILAASPFRADMPEAEVYVPMMSLPRLLQSGPDAIPQAPYLAVSLDRTLAFAQALGPRPKRLRIALAWGGNPAQGDDGLRSAYLHELAPLFQNPDIEWISAQVGPRAAEIPASGLPLTDWSGELTTFDDTAALFMNVDAVVSVCTGPVHLAGAMGIPVICMLSTAADWRWGDNPNYSIWYNSMRLIRQPRQGDWHTVATRAAEVLQTLQPRGLPIDEMQLSPAGAPAPTEAAAPEMTTAYSEVVHSTQMTYAVSSVQVNAIEHVAEAPQTVQQNNRDAAPRATPINVTKTASDDKPARAAAKSAVRKPAVPKSAVAKSEPTAKRTVRPARAIKKTPVAPAPTPRKKIEAKKNVAGKAVVQPPVQRATAVTVRGTTQPKSPVRATAVKVGSAPAKKSTGRTIPTITATVNPKSARAKSAVVAKSGGTATGRIKPPLSKSRHAGATVTTKTGAIPKTRAKTAIAPTPKTTVGKTAKTTHFSTKPKAVAVPKRKKVVAAKPTHARR